MLYPVGTILYNPQVPSIEKVVAHVSKNFGGRQSRYTAIEIIKPKNDTPAPENDVLMILCGKLGESFELRHERQNWLVPVIDIKVAHFGRNLTVMHWDKGYLVFDENPGYPSTRRPLFPRRSMPLPGSPSS